MLKYSSSKIDVMNYCIMRYYLKYIEHEKELELPVFKKGSCLHDLVEHFWSKLDKKYSNADDFGKYGKGKFYQRIIMFESSGKKVDWNYEEEKHIMAESVKKICNSLFDILINEGPPVYSELPFEFVAFKRKFKGKIDEVRIKDNKLVIRDYKSGKPWIGNMKLNHDPQMTLYNVGLCSMAFYDENFAESVGLLKERKKFMGRLCYVNSEIQHEFFMLEAPYIIKLANKNEKIKTIPKVINRAFRTDNHFYEIMNMIRGGEKTLSDGNIYPKRGRKCDDCSMKLACEKKVEYAKKDIIENEKGQFIFNFAAPLFMKPIEEKQKQNKLFKLSRKYSTIKQQNV